MTEGDRDGSHRSNLPGPVGDDPNSERTASGTNHTQASAIEDYALIGDCRTAALVSKTGSIDWLCWPRFDSPACFAALLGSPDNGRWRIAPVETPTRVTRHYWPGTLILETLFETQSGSVALIDFMATDKDSVVRIVEGRSGSVEMHFDLALRFEYGSAVPWVTRLNHGSGIKAIVGPDQVVLRSDVKLHGKAMTTVASFTAQSGKRTRFVLTHAASHVAQPVPPDADQALQTTKDTWTAWCDRCTYRGPYQKEVQRSLLTLKALSYGPTGGIVAAPTTSLPEQPGGSRNWDYRFCWLRDATFTLLALMHAGYREEAQAWGAWLRRSVAGTPAQIQTLYGIAGERWVQEWEVPWLSGYRGASPVRIGNAASAQLQLDVYGELLDALFQEAALGLVKPTASWDLQRALVGHLLGLAVLRCEVKLLRIEEVHPVPVRGLVHTVTLGDGHRHRLLHHDVLTGRDGIEGDLAVQVVGRGDSHHLDAWVLQHLLVVRVAALDAIALRQFVGMTWCRRSDGQGLSESTHRDRGGVDVRLELGADDAYPYQLLRHGAFLVRVGLPVGECPLEASS